MKVELLILIPESEPFCTNKNAFVEFLKLDSLLSITDQKISYRKTADTQELACAKFWVESNSVRSNQERYFLLALESTPECGIDDFYDLCERVRCVSQRISSTKTTINTLWDDVGRHYAEKAYPLINEIENLMRRLIAKFMLITVGINWSEQAIHSDLFSKIERFNEADKDPYINDLFKLDFINLKDVLFGKKRDISTDELDRVLFKTKFEKNDQELIKKFLPRSNWEKYFSNLIEGEDNKGIESKWDILYGLRNKVAHNRHLKRSEFETIKGLCNKLKKIINNASAKIEEIDINEEDRDLIIYNYTSESPYTLGFLSEQVLAKHYFHQGYSVIAESSNDSGFDFTATDKNKVIAVTVKFTRSKNINTALKHTLIQASIASETNFFEPIPTEIHIIFVLKQEDTGSINIESILGKPSISNTKIPISIFTGKISNENSLIDFKKIYPL